jgi:hypothetical protein
VARPEARQLRELFLGRIGEREDAARILVEQLAAFGQRDAARQPVEQHDADAILEFADLAGDSRLTDVQSFRTCADTAGARLRKRREGE